MLHSKPPVPSQMKHFPGISEQLVQFGTQSLAAAGGTNRRLGGCRSSGGRSGSSDLSNRGFDTSCIGAFLEITDNFTEFHHITADNGDGGAAVSYSGDQAVAVNGGNIRIGGGKFHWIGGAAGTLTYFQSFGLTELRKGYLRNFQL